MLNNTLNVVWTYLKDWKNLLAHTLVGLLILAIGLALPIKPIYRIILLVVVIVLNPARMKLSEKKNEGEIRVSIGERVSRVFPVPRPRSSVSCPERIPSVFEGAIGGAVGAGVRLFVFQ